MAISGGRVPGKIKRPGKDKIKIKREYGCCPGQGNFLGTGLEKNTGDFGTEKEKWFNYARGGVG
jgi:hypothetical protein